MSATIDVVNKPPHYQDIFEVKHTQCRAIARLLNFDAGCVFKYVWRSGRKNCEEDQKQDLKKAINYLNDWAELYTLRDGHDIGDYTAARLLFNQLEEPTDQYSIEHRKWEILKEILNDTDVIEIRNESFDAISEEIDALCISCYGDGLDGN